MPGKLGTFLTPQLPIHAIEISGRYSDAVNIVPRYGLIFRGSGSEILDAAVFVEK